MSKGYKSFGFTCLFLLSFVAAASGQEAQPSQLPKLSRPTVMTRPVLPVPQPGMSAGANPDIVQPTLETAKPNLQAMLFPSEGVLIETSSGETVLSQSVDTGFNPASAVKLATALAALKTFGPEHRFDTALWTNGTFEKSTGTITGDLIISGRDPSFHYEHAIDIAKELNRLGIRTITGDLIVPPKFTMNFDWSAQRSGEQLYDSLDVTRRPVAATKAWSAEQALLNPVGVTEAVPSVAVMGAVYVDSVPAGAKMLLVHRSSKLTDILKVLLCYSNNFMAERVGDSVGGPEAVRRIAITEAGVQPGEISLSSTSGLGVNRLTPRSMLKIYRTLFAVLEKHNLTTADILPVAGVDPGTLQKRYTDYRSRGSVIGKTGTLTHTDGGASALVGQMRTANGETLFFVIFNRGGNIWKSRTHQDELISQVQALRGGPQPFPYQAPSLAVRLADTQVNATQMRAEEFEAAPN